LDTIILIILWIIPIIPVHDADGLFRIIPDVFFLGLFQLFRLDYSDIPFLVDYSDYRDYCYDCGVFFSVWIIPIIVNPCNNPNILNNQSSKQ